MKTLKQNHNILNNSNNAVHNCLIPDLELKAIIQEGSPDVADSEWFTKRIMHRLPEKRKRPQMSIAEKLCYIASAVILIAGWGATLVHAWKFGLTPLTVTLAAILPAITLFCALTVAAPVLRRTFGELWP